MAISSEVGIYNLALNAVGSRDNISSPTEASREAEVCNLWYSPVRDQILAGAAWPEATKFRSLALVAEQPSTGWVAGSPRPGYLYAYAVPSDLLRPQYMTDFSQFLLTNHDDNQRVIHSNNAEPVLAYTFRLENISLWSSELQMAVVYGLAAHICMPLSGKPSRAKMLLDRANSFLWAARESAANTSTEQFEYVPESLRQRGYSGGVETRYYYPTGSILSLSNVD